MNWKQYNFDKYANSNELAEFRRQPMTGEGRRVINRTLASVPLTALGSAGLGIASDLAVNRLMPGHRGLGRAVGAGVAGGSFIAGNKINYELAKHGMKSHLDERDSGIDTLDPESYYVFDVQSNGKVGLEGNSRGYATKDDANKYRYRKQGLGMRGTLVVNRGLTAIKKWPDRFQSNEGGV